LRATPVAHLAHHEVRLRVRRLKRAHLSKAAEPGCRLDRIRTLFALNFRPKQDTPFQNRY
jgi:hypothetical protein